MQLLSIKIGKIFSQLKNIGFLGTVKKVFFALRLTIFSIEFGDILFITNGTGDSARYRNWNMAEEFALHGFKCAVTIQDNLWLLKNAKKFKVFIFHRVIYNPKIAKLIAEIKKTGGEIIFSVDDLTFDPQYMIKTDSYENLNTLEKRQYAGGLGLEILQNPYVKTCVTATTYLAGILEKRGKKVFVIPNKLSNEDLELAEKIVCKQKIENLFIGKHNLIRIGYFSGSKSHNRDFATITESLLIIMEKFPKVRLILAGPLKTESRLNKFKNRIKQLPYTAREKHFKNIAAVDINIVPLEIDDPYCESKSELKFFEAGILKVPTVAAATQTFREAISEGVDGFLAKNTGEWIEKLEKLITSENLRKQIGEKAREKALLKYSNKNDCHEEFYGYLENILAKQESGSQP
jgi:glycosyltransferase involved in cell wall biosynthesis